MTASPLHAAAAELHQHGITVIPIRTDGSKAPALRAWQQHTTTPEDIDAWFGGDRPQHGAMGVVCGPASGNLEMLEIEGAYVRELGDIAQLAADSGLDEVWGIVNQGWVETSPSGGVHWFYRIADQEVPGNTKIAQDEPRLNEQGKRYIPTIAETRGAGGQVVIAPTPGTAHPSGKPWARIIGGPATCPVITWEQRDQLHTLLMTLDRRGETTEPEPASPPPMFTGILAQLEATTRPTFDGVSPGDDFEARTRWEDILEPRGWRKVMVRGRTTYWCRPGKDHGISATTGRDPERDRLYVFTSSTEFDTFTPYTKFGAYAVLEHAGDHSAAASKLRKDGYGETPTHAATRQLAATGGLVSGGAPETSPVAETTSTAIAVAEPPAMWGDAGLRSHQRIAARLAAAVEGRYLYVSGAGWHKWDDMRWAPDHRATGINAELTALLRQSWIEALHDKDLAADVKSAMTANGTKGVLELTSVRPGIATEHVDLDPWLLNTPTGTLDLHTLQLKPHDPKDLITKVTNVGYDPNARSETWEHFLATSLPDAEVRGFLQRYAGLALIGKVVEHVLVIAHGNQGRNGKGVFSRTVERVLGSYAITAPADLLVQSRYGDKRSAGELAAIMRLRGARWVTMSELNKGERMDEATMKSLTGGDTLTAKHMGKDPVQFTPSHTIFMAANDLPSVGADSTASWARIRAVPWEVSFVGREDVTLEDRIAQQLPAILAWMVDGLREYQQGGLRAPQAVLAETEKYRSDNDPVDRFITDRCLLGAHHSITRALLLEAYTKWAKKNGEPLLNGRQLAALIRVRPGVEEYKSGTAAWKGITLAAELEEDPPQGTLPVAPQVTPPAPQPHSDPYDGDRGGW